MKLKNIKSLVVAMNLAVGIASINVNAESANIDTLTSNANTNNFIQPWGVQNRIVSLAPNNTQPLSHSYGQIITPTQSQTTLNSFTFALKTMTELNVIAEQGSGAPFEARIYNWNGSSVSGAPIFVSSQLIAPNNNTYTNVKINTGRLALTQGQQYALVFTTIDTPVVGSNDTTYNFYSFNGQSDNYSAGYMVFLNDRNLTTNWGALSAFDLAFIAIFAPSAADTLASMQLNFFALGNAFNLQSAKTAQGLTYDCTIFDVNNMCLSFAGTRSNGYDGFDATTGALIVAHRPTANIRVGAYVDQAIGSSESIGLKVKRGSPSYGLFGVWSQRTDDLGTQLRIAANSGKVDIETTRLAIGTAEAGFGQSNIKSNGVQLEVSQGYALNNQWTTRPYVGYRQMTNKRGGYTEMTSDSVQNPLAYTGLKQTTESILAGIRFVGKLTPQTSLSLSAGIERDVKSTVDNYQASFIDGDAIDPINMTQNVKKTRPTASVGLAHSLDKTQTVGLFVTHRKEALQSSSTTSGMLQYSVGF